MIAMRAKALLKAFVENFGPRGLLGEALGVPRDPELGPGNLGRRPRARGSGRRLLAARGVELEP
jgi:hypothetical protein